MSQETSKKDINFLYESGSLKNIPRAWQQILGMPVENVLEHSFRMMLIALVIARMEVGVGREVNEEKIMKTVLLHDLAEARTTDIAFIHRDYAKHDKEKAVRDQLTGSVFEKEISLLEEYEKRESLESKIVKDADHLEVDIELKELAKMGSSTAIKWQEGRKIIRDTKLATESAKKLWDELQTIDPDEWQLTLTNAYVNRLK